MSAKTGLNVEQIIPSVIKNIPSPVCDVNKPLRALLVDSWHDPYVGVVMLVHIVDGRMKKGMKILSAHKIGHTTLRKLG